MTPAARHAAAIEVLDLVLQGTPVERALTQWGRTHRFAGSGDRTAIRDHVYDVWRARRSLAVLGGGETGRALILGLLRREGIAPETVFGAGGHAPAALHPEETATPIRTPTPAEAADLPDWLWPVWQTSLGDVATAAALVQQARADLHLRVNLSRSTREAAAARLREEGIETVPHPEVATGLVVTTHARRVAASAALSEGLVEVQDAASQLAVAALPLAPGLRVLDYCAGGGGKALAIADRIAGPVWAHDIDAGRMGDIAPRAARAGARIEIVAPGTAARLDPFDLVFVDAPCSGSGTWRRTPEAKWHLTPDRLEELNRMQDEVLDCAAALCSPGGKLAYATCSVLTSENEDRVAAFLDRSPGWTMESGLTLIPSAGHDGFFLTVLGRA